jgi:DNA-binding XRE family transcriptional regulator
MDTCKNIRKQFGLTQQDLAMYLGVNRITIIRIEKGEAVLNTNALLKMADLQKCVEQVESRRKKTLTEETKNYCRKLEEECLFRLASLKRKSVAMQKSMDKCHSLRALLNELDPGSNKHTQAWVKVQAARMEKIASRNNETEQAAQQVLILMCTAQLTALRKYMRDNKIRPVKTKISSQLK